MILRNVEGIRMFLRQRQGPSVPLYRLVFALNRAISDYLTYRNTSGNRIPRGIDTIGWSMTGDCKDHSAMLASLALAAGARVKYVSWTGEKTGHAYLYVRIFRKASEHDTRAVEAYFAEFGRSRDIDMIGQQRPIMRGFDDGLYIACDPTNHLMPGLLHGMFLGPKDKIDMVDFRPDDYGIAPCER
jgi:hypothetical protein